MRSRPLLLALAVLAAACLPVPPGRAPRQAAPPDYDRALLEHLALEAANDAREAHGLPRLRPDASLTRSARAHSADLARTGRLSHTGSDGSSAADRAARAGVRYRALGENLYRSTLYASGTRTVGPEGVVETFDWIAPEDLARDAAEAWLASAGHRANFLNPAFRRAGTGVALDGELRWIVTMDYAD
ncbi:MAG TPA: CAP domain-containing protein [Rubricoccaceae bacterium]|nr:CAP domain-containing protein [Rubricoccaceae bacterium]